MTSTADATADAAAASSVANAVAAASGAITAIPDSFLTNGDGYLNSAIPVTTHVREHAKWVLTDGTPTANASLVTGICFATGANNEALPAHHFPIDVGTLLALGRAAFLRAGGPSVALLSPGEVVTSAELSVHANHAEAVASALGKFAPMAARLVGVAYYNAISFAMCNHHHLPTVNKRLASTTVSLLGMKEFFATTTQAEGIIMHDMFHMVPMAWKSEAARSATAKRVAESLNFTNLAKRVPIKAPDTGIAINYAVLYEKAAAFPKSGAGVPDTLQPPAALALKVDEFKVATMTSAPGKVAALVAASGKLSPASAYLVGYMLGKIRRRDDDSDLTLKDAARSTTILGSPAYARLAGDMVAAFSAGCTEGFKPPTAADRDASTGNLLSDAAANVASV